MQITARQHAGNTIITLVGRLDVHTGPQLRDTLLDHATDLPDAMIVDLDALDLGAVDPAAHHRPDDPAAGHSSMSPLSVFTTVWLELSRWPGIPLHLVCSRADLIGQLTATGVSRFVPTHPGVPGALAAVENPPPRRRAELFIPAATPGAARARRWLTEILTRWGLTTPPAPTATPNASTAATDTQDWVGEVILVVSELVENLLRHARTDGTLRVELRTTDLSIAVTDHDPRPPQLVEIATTRGGRGLALIDQIATAWGHRATPRGGKVVWAVLATPATA